MNLEEIEKNIFVMHPCEEDATKVICEGSLTGEISQTDYLDISKLCDSLKNNKKVKGVRCSAELGLLKFKLGMKTITLFKNGRIIIRMAENKEDVIETMRYIQEISKDFTL